MNNQRTLEATCRTIADYISKPQIWKIYKLIHIHLPQHKQTSMWKILQKKKTFKHHKLTTQTQCDNVITQSRIIIFKIQYYYRCTSRYIGHINPYKYSNYKQIPLKSPCNNSKTESRNIPAFSRNCQEHSLSATVLCT